MSEFDALLLGLRAKQRELSEVSADLSDRRSQVGRSDFALSCLIPAEHCCHAVGKLRPGRVKWTGPGLECVF